MNRMIAGFSGLLFLASAFVAPSAHADIPRPDNGCPKVGAVCSNAGLEGDQAGICTDFQCGSSGATFNCPKCEVATADGGSAGPDGGSGGAADGGAGGEEYQPNTVAGAPNAVGGSNSGTAGTHNSAGAANSTPAATQAGASNDNAVAPSTGSKPNDSDDGGCSIRAIGTEKGIATFLLGLGLAALSVSRRRR